MKNSIRKWIKSETAVNDANDREWKSYFIYRNEPLF